VAQFPSREPTRFVINTVRPDAHFDMMRRETLESLLDGRAKWPDGTPRDIPVPLYERLKLKEAERARS
jgi:hypothetical protein